MWYRVSCYIVIKVSGEVGVSSTLKMGEVLSEYTASDLMRLILIYAAVRGSPLTSWLSYSALRSNQQCNLSRLYDIPDISNNLMTFIIYFPPWRISKIWPTSLLDFIFLLTPTFRTLRYVLLVYLLAVCPYFTHQMVASMAVASAKLW
jgi:hypothetical protein